MEASVKIEFPSTASRHGEGGRGEATEGERGKGKKRRKGVAGGSSSSGGLNVSGKTEKGKVLSVCEE